MGLSTVAHLPPSLSLFLTTTTDCLVCFFTVAVIAIAFYPFAVSWPHHRLKLYSFFVLVGGGIHMSLFIFLFMGVFLLTFAEMNYGIVVFVFVGRKRGRGQSVD